ncbi:sensor histidine kinase [Xanthocytophaga flava]|uniref:sensor histidine kinase n=1 Tax=Xanthocytophaga flava TaxID=3048013 RepID=UPI0028D826DF|nr:two-component regulator propeller domain-containing protein [Xanthocytophaga flavus]MDJ1473353.1 two-component regulator propeller domain-containing protein [Xanthocytophaga flavus]
MVKVFSLLWMWLIVCSCLAQSFAGHAISVSEGLPSSEVYEVFQDSKGFIWFATDNGVAKFDGKQMQNFHIQEGLKDPVVFGFFEDDQKRIWFRTFSGQLFYYEKEIIRPYQWNNKLTALLQRNLLTAIYSKDNQLWFSAEKFFGKVDSVGNIFKEPVDKADLTYKVIEKNCFLVASDNIRMRFVKINSQRFPIHLTSDVQEQKIHCVQFWKGKLYLAIDSMLFVFDGKSLSHVFTGKGNILTLSVDKTDYLWIGYRDKGVTRVEDTMFKKLWSIAYLSTRSVTKILQDHEGGFWFSSLEKGVYYIPNLDISYIPYTDESKTTAVLSTPQVILTGNQTGILSAYDPMSGNIRWQQPLGTYINNLFYTNAKVWASTLQSTFLIDSVLHYKKIYDVYVAGLTKDRKDNVWATGFVRITQFDQQGNCLFFQNVGHSYRKIIADDTLLYLLPRLGLHVYTTGLSLVSAPPQLAGFKIINVTSLNDSVLLLGTVGSGFLLVDKKSWNYRQFDVNHSFIANNIYAVLKAKSLLWLGTEKGIITMDISSLLKGNFTFNNITQSNGLPSNRIAFFAETPQSVWAFSDGGISVIPYTFTHKKATFPPFYLKQLQVNNHSVSLHADSQHSEIDLPYTENNIKLDFGYISFTNQTILTRYRLDGKSRWISSPDRSIQLTSLAPGEYYLEIESSIDNIHWQNVFIPLPIHIHPPWWQRWYVWLSAFALSLLLIYIYYYNRLLIYKQRHLYLKTINTHQQKLIQVEIETQEKERNRIAKELHDGVSTTLSAIRLLVRQFTQSKDDSVASQIEEQFQYTIEELKAIIYALTPAGLDRYGLTSVVKEYVDRLNKATPIKIDLTVYGTQTYTPAINIQVFRVIQELLANSVKHSQAEKITIHLNLFEDLLNLVYEDDGTGILTDENSSIQKQQGFGLGNIESRIRAIQGTIQFESSHLGVSYMIDIPILVNLHD